MFVAIVREAFPKLRWELPRNRVVARAAKGRSVIRKPEKPLRRAEPDSPGECECEWQRRRSVENRSNHYTPAPKRGKGGFRVFPERNGRIRSAGTSGETRAAGGEVPPAARSSLVVRLTRPRPGRRPPSSPGSPCRRR